MGEYKPIEKRHPGRIVLSLVVVCALVVTVLVSGVLFSTAIAADMIIEVGEHNGQATAAQLGSGWGYLPYGVEDAYGVLWGTETQVDIFKSSYKNGRQEITVAGKNNEKVIAPGTENTYTFALKNTDDGWMDYKVMVEAFFTGLDGTGKTIPVQARLQGQSWLVGSETEYRPVLELDGVEESSILRPKSHTTYTLQWQWPFEQDLNGDGFIDDGDALDTWLANQSNDVSLTIRITVLSAYHFHEVTPVPAPVPERLNGIDHLAYLYGFTDGTIRPEANITRAEVAAIFYRLLKDNVRRVFETNVCRYPDVPANAWYRVEAATLTNMGIFEGKPDGLFHGADIITRGEMAAILARISGQKISAEGKTKFPDIQGHWAEAEIMTIEDFNWIEGYPNGNFGPDDPITRAETATMINRMLHRMPEKVADLLPEDMIIWPDNQNTKAWYYLAVQEASNSHTYTRLLGTREKWTSVLDVVQIGKEYLWRVYENP